MLNNITSLTGNGLKDWLVQRVSAVYFAVYALVLFVFFMTHPQLSYLQWQALFHDSWFKLATIVALFMISLHTWIGIWTVSTDYIKCTVIRLSFQLLVVLLLIGQFIWGLMIVWGQ